MMVRGKKMAIFGNLFHKKRKKRRKVKRHKKRKYREFRDDNEAESFYA
jgi:hypothetical protein